VTQADAGSPEFVVQQFIQAMNVWELAAWKLSRAARDSAGPAAYQHQVLAAQLEVFSKFCTARDRPHGRQGSFQRPPEYDPEREPIVRVEVRGSRAYVDTTRDAVLDGGLRRYVLQRHEGAWLIDSAKAMVEGAWVLSSL